MDFFHGQESLTAIQWILRAIVAFLFLLLAAKIMGQRSISQLRLIDFAMAISIGNIIAHPLSDEGRGMKGSMITISVLVVLYSVVVLLSLKWVSFRHLIDSSPIPLIKNGQIVSKNLTKARISVDLLLSELRKEKIEDVQKVALALWEPDGTISSFLYPQYQTLTRADMKIVPEPFSLPSVLIKEGKIDYHELNKTKCNEDWLKNKVTSTYNVDISDVLLATIDKNNNVNVFLYK
ncbi:DUF421 domain-containing protein [Viridibacillus sp. YIM B01967]|uniref:DUF421 domain-containing protein n=1 Tax=Viridibacillus soli TaxID=2798301 RepID=A0ABS1H8L5_9BACL|nr:YetF domain-containing protein [Viridibacillus soli]MBK3495758.1 DUF421 domain-containing protein [Viridibacillus soli]